MPGRETLGWCDSARVAPTGQSELADMRHGRKFSVMA